MQPGFEWYSRYGSSPCWYCLKFGFILFIYVKRYYIYCTQHLRLLRFGFLLASSGMSASVAVRTQPRTTAHGRASLYPRPRTPRTPLHSAAHSRACRASLSTMPRTAAHGRACRACGISVPRTPRTPAAHAPCRISRFASDIYMLFLRKLYQLYVLTSPFCG